MLIRKICQILGKYLAYLSIALCLPLAIAAYCQFLSRSEDHPQPHSTSAFLFALAVCLALSQLLRHFGKKGTDQQLYRRESILIVVLIWIVTSLVSALPFYFSGTLSRPIDAYVEAMSGLTTTGITMLAPKAYDPATGEEIPIHLTNPHVPGKTYTYWGTVAPIRDSAGLIVHSGIEAVGKALLFWRSLLQWIGGIGIIVIFLTVLPALGVGGKFLYQIEMTGPIKEGLTPRVKDTASRIWKLYLFFTLLQLILLLVTNSAMPFFDALCTSLTTISTGGFSVRNDSIASYQNTATEAIVTAFMVVGSINFSLFFHAMRFKFFRIYVPDFFLFLSIAAIGLLAVSAYLTGSYPLGDAFRLGAFQAISMQTTTGFSIADYDLWPFAAQMFMLLLMFVGGMSGSTAGGIKTSRFYILYKIVLHRLESLYRPDSVRKLRIGNAEVDDKNSLTVLSFFCIAAFFSILGTVALVLDGIDPETSVGLMACLMNNVGAAFRAAGPSGSFLFLSDFSKLAAIFWMLLGRLEFYVVLLLFLPAFWKNR